MIDLLLDSNGDLDVSRDDLALIDGAEEIAQGLEIATRSIKGEYFLDRRQGLDAFGRVLGKSDPDVRDAEIKREILARPGISEILSYEASVDVSTRHLSVVYTARTDEGVTFEVTSSPGFIPALEVEEIITPPVVCPVPEIDETTLVARASVITPIAARLVATAEEV